MVVGESTQLFMVETKRDTSLKPDSGCNQKAGYGSHHTVAIP